MAFYQAFTLGESERKLQQGDILYPVPFAGFSVTEVVVLTPDAEEPTTVNLTETTEPRAETQLLTSVGISHGMVLNQTCDLSDQPERGKPILIARILRAEERVKALQPDSTVKKRVGAIKAMANPGKSPSVFYLPEYEGADFHLPKCVVDLLEATSFPPANLTH
jgi:hypothetical protein